MINEGKLEHIKKMIKIDPKLTSRKGKELWQVLENYAMYLYSIKGNWNVA